MKADESFTKRAIPKVEVLGKSTNLKSFYQPSLADWLNLCTVSSTEQETARAPTRELEDTPRRRSHSRKCLHKFWDFGRCSCRNFGTCIITLMLSSGPVRRDGFFWDFGSLYQGQVPHVAMGRSQFCAS